VAGKTKKVTPKQKIIEVKAIPSLEPKLGRVYSNYVAVSNTKFDFTIRFGDLPPGGDVERLRQGKELIIPTIIDIIVVPDLIPGIIQALDAHYKKYLEQSEDIAEQNKETVR